MPYPTAILFVGALSALALAALGWSMEPEAPAFWDWLAARVAGGGLWTGLVLFWALAAFVVWRNGKPPAPRDGGDAEG